MYVCTENVVSENSKDPALQSLAAQMSDMTQMLKSLSAPKVVQPKIMQPQVVQSKQELVQMQPKVVQPSVQIMVSIENVERLMTIAIKATTAAVPVASVPPTVAPVPK